MPSDGCEPSPIRPMYMPVRRRMCDSASSDLIAFSSYSTFCLAMRPPPGDLPGRARRGQGRRRREQAVRTRQAVLTAPRAEGMLADALVALAGSPPPPLGSAHAGRRGGARRGVPRLVDAVAAIWAAAGAGS